MKTWFQSKKIYLTWGYLIVSTGLALLGFLTPELWIDGAKWVLGVTLGAQAVQDSVGYLAGYKDASTNL